MSEKESTRESLKKIRFDGSLELVREGKDCKLVCEIYLGEKLIDRQEKAVDETTSGFVDPLQAVRRTIQILNQVLKGRLEKWFEGHYEKDYGTSLGGC